jgi:hypothetical protein
MNRTHIHIESCFTCGQGYQYGPSIYAGEHLPTYDVAVCSTCYGANWDGWAPVHERKLLAHLVATGRPVPSRNAKGWLPRD